MTFRFGLIGLLIASLSGCFLEITVGEGGEVQSASGLSDCAENSLCSIEVLDTTYRETFVAVPKSGYRFVGWDDGEDHQCKGSFRTICTVDNTGFAGNTQAEAVIASNKKYFLKPIFERTGAPRYVARDADGAFITDDFMKMGDSGADARLVYTDTGGMEHGYYIGIRPEGLSIFDSLTGRWNNASCSGDFTHVDRDEILVFSPLFSETYMIVHEIDHYLDGIYHLAKLAPKDSAYYGSSYHLTDGLFGNPPTCVESAETWLVPVEDIVIRNVDDQFTAPFTLSRE